MRRSVSGFVKPFGFWLATAIAVITAILLFGHLFGFDLPLASRAFWSNPRSDMIAMTGGYEAFLQERWRLPLGWTDALTPHPITIVYTDSIPWVSILLKASGAGAMFNPLGVFILISYPLQAAAMAVLLRALGVTQFWPVLIGCLLALLLPTWMGRLHGHTALGGHWLLIFALALAVTSARRGASDKVIAGFAVLGFLAVGIHAYHLVPIAACFAAALGAELMLHGLARWRRLAAAIAVVGMAVLIPALLLGYAEGGPKATDGRIMGLYSMNLLGPVYPEASQFFRQVWLGDWYYNTLNPNGGQAFEGFQYLGAGILLTTLVLIIRQIWLATRRRGDQGHDFDSPRAAWLPLGVVLVLMTAWAVGPIVYVGNHLLLDLKAPEWMIDTLGVFRAHGRFFWIVSYILLALGVAACASLPGRMGPLLLATALALQVYDTTQLRIGLRDNFSSPARPLYPSALLTAPQLRNRPWVFTPTYFCSRTPADLRAISELGLVGVRTGGQLNSFITVRSADPLCDLRDPAITKDAAPGDQRITVALGGGAVEGGDLAAFAARSDCRRFERGVLCGRDLDNIAGLEPIAAGELSAGARRQVSAARLDRPGEQPVLGLGWSDFDPGGKGRWSDGHHAVIHLKAPAQLPPKGSLIVEMTLIGYSDAPIRPMPVKVSADGRQLKTLAVDPTAFNIYRIYVPTAMLRADAPFKMLLDMPDARAAPGDARLLGVAIQEVRILL